MTACTLTTPRLVIRRFLPADGEGLYRYLSDPETVRFEPYEPFSRDEALAEAARRATDERFYAVCLRPDADGGVGALIGNLTLFPADFGALELGFVFHRAFWGKGYAAESAQALLRYSFTALSVRRVVAMCDPLNTRSWRLLERLFFRREGHLVRNVYFRTDESGEPIWKDTYLYARLRDEEDGGDVGGAAPKPPAKAS